MSEVPLPPFDPLGIQVPVPVLLALAYLTFTLHLAAVQFTLGSVGLAWWQRLRRGPDAPAAHVLASMAPLGFSYLVTFGIPPLLFVQVLYGQFFYSSSVLMGTFWILVIPLLIVSYASLYAHRLTRQGRPGLGPWLLGIALLGMLTIGFFYVNNLTLAMTPARWLEHYLAHPNGAALNLQEETIWGRWLTVLGPGPLVAAFALRPGGSSGDPSGTGGADNRALARGGVLVGALLGAAGLGLFWATLPEAARAILTSGGTWTFWTGVGLLLGLITVALAWQSTRIPARGWAVGAAVTHLLALACLVVVRDRIRWAYLEGFFSPDSVPMRPAPGMFTIFAVTLVAGLVFLAVVGLRRPAPARPA